MDEAQNLWSQRQQPVPAQCWDTADVPRGEAFEYYRDAICAAFMPLRPELDRDARAGFDARVTSHSFAGGALNRVRARAHTVLKRRAEIAASAVDCYYLNLQLGGQCRILQGQGEVVLTPGEVMIFDGAADFELDHSGCRDLAVASLLVPKAAVELAGVEGQAVKLSGHALFGPLLADSFRALVQAVDQSGAQDVTALHDVVLSLASKSASAQGGARPGETVGRAAAQTRRILRAIADNATNPDFTATDCATELGLSVGHLRNLLRGQGTSFGRALLQTRLRLAAAALRQADHAHLPVYAIALEVGFRDASHFSRAFRARYGVSPRDWRGGAPI